MYAPAPNAACVVVSPCDFLSAKSEIASNELVKTLNGVAFKNFNEALAAAPRRGNFVNNCCAVLLLSTIGFNILAPNSRPKPPSATASRFFVKGDLSRSSSTSVMFKAPDISCLNLIKL